MFIDCNYFSLSPNKQLKVPCKFVVFMIFFVVYCSQYTCYIKSVKVFCITLFNNLLLSVMFYILCNHQAVNPVTSLSHFEAGWAKQNNRKNKLARHTSLKLLQDMECCHTSLHIDKCVLHQSLLYREG